jgi:A1 cistron-splicing factor AAR2
MAQQMDCTGDETGLFAVLNLPVGSVLTFDGQPVVLKRDDFVGFTFPLDVGKDDLSLHMVTARAGRLAKKGHEATSEVKSAVTAGFLFGWKEVVDEESSNVLVRRFEPTTEEVSSVPVDALTTENLWKQIQERKIDNHRVIPLQQFLSLQKVEEWKALANFVSLELLEKRGIQAGAKIVPGAYCSGEDANEPTSGTDPFREQKKVVVEDGTPVQYPPIPVISASASSRHSRHLGTKQYLEQHLTSPRERTALFTSSSPASCTLRHVLSLYYDDQFRQLLGDVQLSYCLFLHLHCYASLTHWRDLVALLCSVETDGINNLMTELYADFLDVLECQVRTMEGDFFEDLEYSGDTFLVPALRRLVAMLSAYCAAHENNEPILSRLSVFRDVLRTRFANHFEDTLSEHVREPLLSDVQSNTMAEESDDDAPIVVSLEEVEASLERSAELRTSFRHFSSYSPSLRRKYPLLFAAMDSNTQEDVLMTCARILDEKTDVSLVREAAAYLEQVEAKKSKPHDDSF